MKKLKFKKSSQKGMTLLEIIISLAVLSAMVLVLITTSSLINSYIKSANNVNGKVARQAPVAENGNRNGVNMDATQVAASVPINVAGVNLYGDAYAVIDPSAAADGQLGGDLNMYFIDLIEPTTGP